MQNDGVQGNHYQVLGIDPQAAPPAIKAAYRRLARCYHPDVNPGAMAQQQFQRVLLAYEVLADPHKRQQYDQLLARGLPQHPSRLMPGMHSTPAHTAQSWPASRGIDPLAHKRQHLLMTKGMVHFFLLFGFCFLGTLVQTLLLVLVLNLVGIEVGKTRGLGALLLFMIVAFIGTNFRLGQRLIRRYPRYLRQLTRYFHAHQYRPPV
ncbi:MAG: J domain-containing protein [Sphingobacteriia bacterium]